MKKLLTIFYLISLSFTSNINANASQLQIQLYNNATELVNKGKLVKAREQFQHIQLSYPFSALAIKAQKMSAFASYMLKDYTKTIIDTEKYIDRYYNTQDIQYIYYLRAMSYYKQIKIIDTDSTPAQDALEAFNRVIKKFPKTEYAKEAQIKYDEIMNYLAAKEMNIGLFYFKVGNYASAIQRFKIIDINYGNTDYVPEALLRLTESFKALNMFEEAEHYHNEFLLHLIR